MIFCKLKLLSPYLVWPIFQHIKLNILCNVWTLYGCHFKDPFAQVSVHRPVLNRCMYDFTGICLVNEMPSTLTAETYADEWTGIVTGTTSDFREALLGSDKSLMVTPPFSWSPIIITIVRRLDPHVFNLVEFSFKIKNADGIQIVTDSDVPQKDFKVSMSVFKSNTNKICLE